MNRIRNIANEAASLAENPSTLFANVFVVNEAADGLRWGNLSPYGDWPNAQGLQRFTQADAQNIVNEFNSIAKRVINPSTWLGLPWYVGHPDHPAFANKYKDGKAYGRIKKLEAREDGLYAGVKFNEDGEKMLSNESFGGHSVNWFLKQDPSDRRAWRPFKLKSVGFTNEPNIPVEPFTTANEGVLTPEDFLAGNELFQAHAAKLARFRLFGNSVIQKSDEGVGLDPFTVTARHKSRFKKIAKMRKSIAAK